MNKQKFFTILYVVLIISLILFMIWIVQFMRGNAKECLADPIKYFENKNDGASCYCMKGNAYYGEQQFNEENNLNIP